MPFVCYKKVLYLQLLNSDSVCIQQMQCTYQQTSECVSYFFNSTTQSDCVQTDWDHMTWFEPKPTPTPIQYVRTSFPSSFASSAGKKNTSLIQGKISLRWTRWKRQNNLWIYGGKSWMLISARPPCMTAQSSESHGVNVKPLKGNWYWIG